VLAGFEPIVVICSPLQRAVTTAEVIAAAHVSVLLSSTRQR
jgi:broad specificity phosphatase PhoE